MRFRIFVIVLLALALPALGAAQTVKRQSARRTATLEGADSYKAYCAVCHGPEGKGDGPAAVALKTKPPDLTRLAAQHNGKFEQMEVEHAILGRDKSLVSHGTEEMPIWGPVFTAIDTDTTWKLRVHNLVEHVRAMQAK